MICRIAVSFAIAANVMTGMTVNLQADESYYDGVGNDQAQLELISLGSDEAEGSNCDACCSCCPDPWVVSRDPIFATRILTI